MYGLLHGHVGGFSDPLIDCKECKTRHRADKLIEEWMHENNCEQVVDGWPNEKMIEYMKEHHIACPNCGKENFTGVKKTDVRQRIIRNSEDIIKHYGYYGTGKQ